MSHPPLCLFTLTRGSPGLLPPAFAKLTTTPARFPRGLPTGNLPSVSKQLESAPLQLHPTLPTATLDLSSGCPHPHWAVPPTLGRSSSAPTLMDRLGPRALQQQLNNKGGSVICKITTTTTIIKVQNFHNVNLLPHKYLLMSGYLRRGNVVEKGDWFRNQLRSDRRVSCAQGPSRGVELSAVRAPGR